MRSVARKKDRLSEISTTRGAWESILSFFKEFHNKTVLLQWGRVYFVTYGILTGLAFAVGGATAALFHALAGHDLSSLLVFYVLGLFPAVLVGARLFSVLLEWRQLFVAPWQTLFKPGFMLHGGVLGGAVAIAGYSMTTGVPMLSILDAWALALPVGEGIARVGCYVYGCCWGKPTGHDSGVCYTSKHAKVVRCAPHLAGRPLHRAQLYSAGASLGLFLFLLALLPWISTAGILIGLYLLLHPITRVILERYRLDDRGRLLGPITHTQLYSAIQFVLGLGVLLVAPTLGIFLTLQPPTTVLALLTQPQTLLTVTLLFVLAALAFGLHLDQVGSWGQRTSPNTSTSTTSAPSSTESGELLPLSLKARDRF